MKKISLVFSILFILLVAVFSFLFLSGDKKINPLSPIPDFVNLLTNKQAFTLNLWSPAVDPKITFAKGPEITGRSALLYDLTTGKTLYSKNPKEKMPLASITKIMTAMVALDNPKEDNRYLVRKEYLVGESSMGLEEGEVLSLEELMYGLVLHSGNDATETIAGNFPGGRDAFIKAMNDKAKALGVLDTNFTNPSGLNGEGNQYSTAYDILVMTRFALENYPLFKKVVATPEMTIAADSNHKQHVLLNETNLLTTYPGVKGVKTGYTGEAGYCLVTYLDYQGHEVIGILLGSQNRRDEMKELLDYSLLQIGISPPPHQ